jgi:hypothetical protein
VLLRQGTWLAAIGCALVLAGCGGSDESTANEPAIPGAVAERLAAQSDEIADLLAAGAVCDAAHLADELKDETVSAINANQIPAAFQEELMSTVNELQNEVNCPPPTTTEEEDPCADLEQQKADLDAQKEDAEGNQKEEIERQLKEVERKLEHCRKKNGEGEGDGG